MFTMATIPFSCHQQFIWCHVDDKLSFIKDYLSLISAGQRTVILVRDITFVRNVVTFLWDCGIPVVYHHSGHLGNLDRLAQVMDDYLSTSRPAIISQESYCRLPFYHTATRVLVVDFPNSIDHYRDYKTLIDFTNHKGLVTALVSQNESPLLPKLKDYIQQKGEHPPPWLAQEPVMSRRIANPTGRDSSNGDNFSHGNIKSFLSCPVPNKPERRNPPLKPPFIGPNILDRPLVPDPEKSWNEVGVSSLHPQSNSYSTWPSQERVSREVTYRYGPPDIQKGIGLSAQNSHSLTYDSHQYDSLLSKHLSSTRRKSPTKSQSSSISHHKSEYKSQSYANNHPPFTDTDNCWDRRNSLVSKQLGSGLVPPLDLPSLCKPQSSMHPHCGSIPSQSCGSNDLAPSRSIISQDPICPISPRSKANIAPVAPLVDSNPSPYSNSEDEDIEGDNVDSPFNGDHSGQCSSDYSDDGGDLSDGSGEYSDSDLSEDSNESDDSSGDSDDDIDSDSFVDSDSTSNASSSKDYSSDFSTAGDLPEVIFTPYECQLFEDSSWCNNASKDYVLEESQCVLHSNHSSDAEHFPNILRPLHCTPFSTNSHNPGGCLIHNHSSKDYVGTNDGPSADDSDQEDFLQLGAYNSTPYASSPQTNYFDVTNPIVSLQVLAEPITTASVSKAQNSGNNFSENTITKTEDITYPFIPSKDSTCNTEQVGALCGPGVPHADITKHTSCSSLCPPRLVQAERSSLVAQRIAAGLGSCQDTTGVSDSLSTMPTNGDILHNPYGPSSLDFPGENISHSSASSNGSHITKQAMLETTRLPSEDVSSPFSLVNTDIPSNKDGTVPIVDIHPGPCSMLNREVKDPSSCVLYDSSSTQYVPSIAFINCNVPGELPRNTDPLNSQLNHKGLVSMASDQPQ